MIAIWARLSELPIEFYDNSILQQIGNQLGDLLKIDARTIDNVQGRFARLCIQVDLDSPLVSKVRIGSLAQPVQYEGYHPSTLSVDALDTKLLPAPLSSRPLPQPCRQIT